MLSASGSYSFDPTDYFLTNPHEMLNRVALNYRQKRMHTENHPYRRMSRDIIAILLSATDNAT